MIARFFDLIDSLDPFKSQMLLTTSLGSVSGEFFLLRTVIIRLVEEKLRVSYIRTYNRLYRLVNII